MALTPGAFGLLLAEYEVSSKAHATLLEDLKAVASRPPYVEGLGLSWLDPVMGLVGAVLVARWSLGLLKTTGSVLLDRQGPAASREEIRRRLEQDGDEVVDLHLWPCGPGIYALIVSVVTDSPKSPSEYRSMLPANLRIAHVTIEPWPQD